jgi:hypothetical protein
VLVQGVLAQVKAVLWLEATASLYASEFCCQQLLGHGSSILFLFGSVLFCCSVLPHGWQECGKSVARVWQECGSRLYFMFPLGNVLVTPRTRSVHTLCDPVL